ncbi:occludin [Bacteroides eggerthii]|uniref:occludin n=1 Tax=Bacteroides eggerthii TaxID=28111 RepID=UPI0018984C46|nr:occludin [Bacteroides eggerthii]
MKQVCLFIIALFAGSISLYAQSEAQGDSIRSHVLPDGTPPEGALMPEVKNYDGFLLDMSLLKMEAPRLPEFTLEIPDASKDYSRMFRLNPNATYSQGLSNVFSLTNSTVYSMNPFGLSGFWSSPENLQMGSFRLKNGMRINTYGEYDKDGWKVPNHSALPWEKNNFKGAFEMKYSNGAFGIRIEVQQGNRTPF